MRISQRYQRLIWIILFVVSLIWVGMYLSPVTYGFDENYTMALVHHSYAEMIHLDTLDVHPFLYYLLLKTFIKLTTFYTSSPLIKVFSARCLSLLLSVGAFYFLHRLARSFGIHNRPVTEWILFLILPGILNDRFMDNAQLTNVRMYPLMALLIIMEFYYLLRYWLNGSRHALVIATVVTALAFYTHYYAAMLGGGLLLAYFIRAVFSRRCHQSLQLFVSGVIVILLFVPWLPVLLRQASDSSTYWMNSAQEHLEFLNLFWILIIFAIPLYWYQKRHLRFRHQLGLLCLLLGGAVLLTLGYALKVGDAFQCRYLFPFLLIYEFLGLDLAWSGLSQPGGLQKIISILIILLMLVNSYDAFLGNNAWVRTRPLAAVYHPETSVERLSSRIANDHSATTVLISDLINNHQRIIVPVRSRQAFRQHSHVYWNATYRQVFHNEIKRISYR